MSDANAPFHARLIIVGSGPAGYTAAIYSARAMLEPVMIAGFEPGGQLMITTDVENYPGFKDPIQGPWLMEQMKAQAEHVGTRMISDHIVNVDLSKHPFRLQGDSGAAYTCDTLVIATGAKAKWLGMPTEEKFKGYGVSACATCDGFFYRNKHVTVVHRRDHFRSERILQERLFRHPKVEVVWDTVIEEICGDEQPLGVTHVKLRNVKTGDIAERPVHGVFVAIGHEPASELFAGQLDIKPNGYIRTAADSTATNVPGVFAAGDVTDDIYRQAVTAAGMGCMAALEAERWLAAEENARAAAE